MELRAGTNTTLRHVTLAANSTVGGSGGNLYRDSTTAVVTVGDSIIADGSSTTGNPNCTLNGGSLTTTGRNLDTTTTCGFGPAHLNATPAQLEPLADRGGPTDTRAPMTASATRDAALACDPAGTDQRGGPPAAAGAACDIGAVELAADLVTTLTASRGSVAPGGDLTYIARATNTGADSAPATVLDLALPAGAELVQAAPSDGTCTGDRCDVGLIPRGGSATVAYVVRAPATGPLVASATSSSAHPDPDATDDTASVTTGVDAAVVPPGGGPGAGPGAGPGTTTADATAPVLGTLKAVGRVRRGRAATISTTVSEAARMTITVHRLVAGRRVGKACRTGRRRGTRCTVARRVGAASATVAKGSARFRLPARVGGRALAVGRHRITVVATDAAGNRSRGRTLTVTVRR